MIKALLIICANLLVDGNLLKCKSNKCNKNADCELEANNKGELKPTCKCKPGFHGDGIKCEEKFTLVVELCRNQDGSLIHNALRPLQSNTSMTLNFWMYDEETHKHSSIGINYTLPSVDERQNEGKTMTYNYYDKINIFHITKLKIIQEFWQKICLQRLSIHQGDAYIYILRTLDKKAYEPSWSDCADPNDPTKCVVYTWWKKRCPNRKRSSNGEIDACRSKALYKHALEPNLYIRNECDSNSCGKNAKCIETKPGYACQCLAGFAGDGRDGCEDVDECATSEHNCGPNAKCKNGQGSFSCHCNNGFISDGDECKEVHSSCKSEDLPKNAVTVSNGMKTKRNGAIFRVKCEEGNITPLDPKSITELTAYKARCICEDGGCSWSLSPRFSCESGCPHKHLANIKTVRSWKDASDKRDGLFQVKFKVKFKPPSGIIDGWRILIKFGVDISSYIIRTSNSEVIIQEGRHLLLGNSSTNGRIDAEEGTFGFLFKITHVEKEDKDQIANNIIANFVGSDVQDLECFS